MTLQATERIIYSFLVLFIILICYFVVTHPETHRVQQEMTFEVGKPLGRDINKKIYQAGKGWQTYIVTYGFNDYFVTVEKDTLTKIKKLD